ncbi:MAG: hypothetical protein JWQ98_1216 [Chlorobi bacterium]|nr:hypothetical protein [Chlorobiota bacterium]
MQEPPYNPDESRSLYQDEEASPVRRKMSSDVWIGLAMIVAGLVVTMVSYAAASSGSGGGRYMITFGLFIFGIIRVVRGLSSR